MSVAESFASSVFVIVFGAISLEVIVFGAISFDVIIVFGAG